jgi:tRNA(fMet)-specific endonuclease VapC
MSISYLIDTDWAVHHLNGMEEIRMKLVDMKSDGLGLSVISLAELCESVYYSRDSEASQRQLASFLASVTVLGVNEEVCRIFGQQRGYLRQHGLMIGDFDLLIAATCLHYDLTLLTNNRRHFQRIEDLKIISMER